MTSRKFRIAQLDVRPAGTQSRTGTTTGNNPADGEAELWDITGPGGLHLTIADSAWDNGERDVATIDRHGSPSRFDRLVHGLRLGIQPHRAPNKGWIELRQARPGAKQWPTLHTATLDELRYSAGTDVARTLTSKGADVGTRADIIGDTGRRRSHLCAAFVADNLLVPITAYLLTRVAPIQTQRWVSEQAL